MMIMAEPFVFKTLDLNEKVGIPSPWNISSCSEQSQFNSENGSAVGPYPSHGFTVFGPSRGQNL